MRIPLSRLDARRLAEAYEPQFRAADELLVAVWEGVPQRGRNTFDVVLMNVLGRSIGSYRALLHLLRGGFTDQSWMVNRSLFEDMVFGYWIALDANRDNAVNLIEGHQAKVNTHVDELLGRMRRGGLEALGDRTVPLQRSGRSSLMPSLDKRVDEVLDLWDRCGGSRDELLAHHEVTHWHSHLSVHTSSKSLLEVLHRGAVRTPGGAVLYGYGQASEPEETQMLFGFECSAFRLAGLARLVMLEHERPLGRLESAYEQLIAAVRKLAPSHRARVGRNDPCWCGSGRKLKKCHGAPAADAAVEAK